MSLFVLAAFHETRSLVFYMYVWKDVGYIQRWVRVFSFNIMGLSHENCMKEPQEIKMTITIYLSN